MTHYIYNINETGLEKANFNQEHEVKIKCKSPSDRWPSEYSSTPVQKSEDRIERDDHFYDSLVFINGREGNV